MCRKILGVFCYALDCAIDGSATVKVRFDWIRLKLDKETCKDADTLWKVLDETYQKTWWLTVCGGGTLECPPRVETITLVFTRPFSAMAGIAMTEPAISPYAPARAMYIKSLSHERIYLSTQHSLPSSTSRANASSPYIFSISAERCWAP